MAISTIQDAIDEFLSIKQENNIKKCRKVISWSIGDLNPNDVMIAKASNGLIRSIYFCLFRLNYCFVFKL